MKEPKQPMSERMRLIRWRMTREKSRFSDEIRLIPQRLVWLMIALLIIAEVVAQIANHISPAFPEFRPEVGALMLAGIVTGVGIVVSCLIFLFGYINRDAKRRGMSPTLWTLLAILVPYLIGVIIYFLLREPLPFNCPQCGAMVSARFNYCPSCQNNLRPSCPQCRREVGASDRYCPNCAHDLKTAATPVII
jgi:hypothetical protein